MYLNLLLVLMASHSSYFNPLFCFHGIGLNVFGFKKLYLETLSRFPNTLGFQVSCRCSYCLNPKEFKLQELMVNFTYDVVYAVCNTVCVCLGVTL